MDPPLSFISLLYMNVSLLFVESGYTLTTYTTTSACMNPWDAMGFSLQSPGTCDSRSVPLTGSEPGEPYSIDHTVCRCETDACNLPNLADDKLCYYCHEVDTAIPGFSDLLSLPQSCSKPTKKTCKSSSRCSSQRHSVNFKGKYSRQVNKTNE